MVACAGLIGCQGSLRSSSASEPETTPIVPLREPICRDQLGLQALVITAPAQLVEALSCPGHTSNDRTQAQTQAVLASVDFSRQWLHVSVMQPDASVQRVDEREDEIVVKVQTHCSGGAPEPDWDLALALPLPVRPVRFDVTPHRDECPMLP